MEWPVSRTDGVRSIIEFTLEEHPDFDHTQELTKQIDERVIRFIEDIEQLLATST
ncbi:DUF7000 family protein [Planococcus halocryophilus]|uniref:DUF7000 family protein n=1 Tax=Planococcus halocryophilus TaxID=1215089 RepID=UPI0039B72198